MPTIPTLINWYGYVILFTGLVSFNGMNTPQIFQPFPYRWAFTFVTLIFIHNAEISIFVHLSLATDILELLWVDFQNEDF